MSSPMERGLTWLAYGLPKSGHQLAHSKPFGLRVGLGSSKPYLALKEPLIAKETFTSRPLTMLSTIACALCIVLLVVT